MFLLLLDENIGRSKIRNLLALEQLKMAFILDCDTFPKITYSLLLTSNKYKTSYLAAFGGLDYVK
jgi:hypothetical protein